MQVIASYQEPWCASARYYHSKKPRSHKARPIIKSLYEISHTDYVLPALAAEISQVA
jgi:hypothetical protein